MNISHLQFVDDTLIFCKNSVTQLMYLRCAIRCFEAVSSLNLANSCSYGVG